MRWWRRFRLRCRIRRLPRCGVVRLRRFRSICRIRRSSEVTGGEGGGGDSVPLPDPPAPEVVGGEAVEAIPISCRIRRLLR